MLSPVCELVNDAPMIITNIAKNIVLFFIFFIIIKIIFLIFIS
jgi:hypothetical protein